MLPPRIPAITIYNYDEMIDPEKLEGSCSSARSCLSLSSLSFTLLQQGGAEY
jgi:hypothetical protein